MADNVTNELILEHLKALREVSKNTRLDIADIKADIRIIKGHMAAFMQSEVRQDEEIASLQARLDRIEKRLELSE